MKERALSSTLVVKNENHSAEAAEMRDEEENRDLSCVASSLKKKSEKAIQRKRRTRKSLSPNGNRSPS